MTSADIPEIQTTLFGGDKVRLDGETIGRVWYDSHTGFWYGTWRGVRVTPARTRRDVVGRCAARERASRQTPQGWVPKALACLIRLGERYPDVTPRERQEARDAAQALGVWAGIPAEQVMVYFAAAGMAGRDG